MAAKPKPRVAPRIDLDDLTPNLIEQLASGQAAGARAASATLPALESPRGQPARIERCLLETVTLSHPSARRLRLEDSRIQASDFANIDLTSSSFDRVEIASTRLTGATFTEATLKNVLFRDAKLDLALFRMARLQQCVFEQCNLTDADFYSADLSGAIFRNCDLSRADLGHARLTGADLRNCRIDGMRGTPAAMEGLIISPDQAPLLITLFGVRVVW